MGVFDEWFSRSFPEAMGDYREQWRKRFEMYGLEAVSFMDKMRVAILIDVLKERA